MKIMKMMNIYIQKDSKHEVGSTSYKKSSLKSNLWLITNKVLKEIINYPQSNQINNKKAKKDRFSKITLGNRLGGMMISKLVKKDD